MILSKFRQKLVQLVHHSTNYFASFTFGFQSCKDLVFMLQNLTFYSTWLTSFSRICIFCNSLYLSTLKVCWKSNVINLYYLKLLWSLSLFRIFLIFLIFFILNFSHLCSKANFITCELIPVVLTFGTITYRWNTETFCFSWHE